MQDNDNKSIIDESGDTQCLHRRDENGVGNIVVLGHEKRQELDRTQSRGSRGESVQSRSRRIEVDNGSGEESDEELDIR